MKNIQFLVVFFLAAFTAGSQQLPTSSFYELQSVLHNPGAIGTRHFGSVGGSFRSQWSGMPGGPQTGFVYGNTYLAKSRLGLGAVLMTDKAGYIKNNTLKAGISYHIPMENDRSLSFGIEAKVGQFSMDMNKMMEVLTGQDPVLANNNRIQADANVGIAYTTPKFQIGASVNQLIQNKIDLYDDSRGSGVEEARQYRHFFVHSNYTWDVDAVTKIIPNFLLIYLPNAPLEFSGGARVEHNNLFWYGLGLRARQSWSVSAGVHVKQRFHVGYSFDIYNSPLNVYTSGSGAHEVMLRYDFTK